MKEPIRLKPGEQERLLLIARGAAAGDVLGVAPASPKDAPHVRLRARILLFLQTFHASDIAAACDCTTVTVYNIRRRYRTEGLEAALIHKTIAHGSAKQEMARQIVALRQSEPPAGHSRWTLDLLARTIMERGIAPQISVPTVCRILHQYGAGLTPPPSGAPKPTPQPKRWQRPRENRSSLPLTPEETAHLEALVSGESPDILPGKTAAARDNPPVRRRAKILLLSRDITRPVPVIAKDCGCTEATVYTILHRYRTEGLAAALAHKTYTYTKLVTTEMEERIIALSQGAPPAGHRRWTNVLLAEAAVEQGIAASISHATVARIRQKHRPRPDLRPPAVVELPRVQRKTREPLVLKEGERERLEGIVKAGEGGNGPWTDWQVQRAAALLYLAATPALTKKQAAGFCHCSYTLIDAVTRHYEEGGLERVLRPDSGGRFHR
ncbi:hypothetical protein AGMMS49942_21140 [Spirochaetia bacterium]|nr:hypothetical protein AGMMS49942_21140 [Spirochaetia bacterium]